MDKKYSSEFLKKSILEFKKAVKNYKTSIASDGLEHAKHGDISNMTHIANKPSAHVPPWPPKASDHFREKEILSPDHPIVQSGHRSWQDRDRSGRKPPGEGSPAPAMLKQDNAMAAGDVNTVSAGASAAMKSDEEPHKDDPHHEEKEKKIAEKVKALAEKQLKMHKSIESVRIDSNGQWAIDNSDTEL